MCGQRGFTGLVLTCVVCIIILHYYEDSYLVFSKNLHGNLYHIGKAFSKWAQDICPDFSPYLVGPIRPSLNSTTLEDILSMPKNMQDGGYYEETSCKSNTTVAILVAFRDRKLHLQYLLLNLIPVLKRQQINFQIFVIEQLHLNFTSNKTDIQPFNRAMLFNVGFVEANKLHDFDCFIFHDVDHLPENDRNLYKCSEEAPIHLATAVQKFGYKMPYSWFFGGVSAFTKEQFFRVDGFSNSFWGWGGEDDEMRFRTEHHGYKIIQRSSDLGRYSAIEHKQEVPNPDRYKVLDAQKQRVYSDGLSDLNYNLQEVILYETFTLFKVKLPIMRNYSQSHAN